MQLKVIDSISYKDVHIGIHNEAGHAWGNYTVISSLITYITHPQISS